MEIRIGTWNMWGLFGNWKQRRQALESLWNAELAPDVLCLQEVCVSDDYDQIADLLQLTGYPHHIFAPSHRYDNITEGIAIFSQFPIQESVILQLPLAVPFNQRSENPPRIALVASLRGVDFQVACSHLSFYPPEDNRYQINFLLNSLLEAPTVIAADFNIKQIDFLYTMKNHPQWRVDGLHNYTWPNNIQQFINGWQEKTGKTPHFEIEQSQLDYILTNQKLLLIDSTTHPMIYDDRFVSDHALLINKYKREPS